MDDGVYKKIDQLRASVDLLTLVELCKLGASRGDVREVFGTLDNNVFAKVNTIVKKKQEHKQNAKKEK
ncbi:MAG TPA: hypothetical protein VHR84_14715 [Terriglobales bacterium]|jgi:hypothetical protein|nr:hypothetical protein [Terriglobales bacterium]